MGVEASTMEKQPYTEAARVAEQKWPVTGQSKIIIILRPQYPFEPELPEYEAERLTSEWAGAYAPELDELVLFRIRKREPGEVGPGEPYWKWHPGEEEPPTD